MATVRAGVSYVDLTDSSLYREGFPHDVFTSLRRDAPVHWQSFPAEFPGDHDTGFWVLAKHADIEAVSRNPAFFSAFDGPQLNLRAEISGMTMVSMDGAPHRRQRRLVSAGFTPRMVRRLDDQIRAWADQLVSRALQEGECNFVSAVAYQLPMHTIADIVGIPLEDRDWLFGMVNDLLLGNTIEHARPAEEVLATQVALFEYASKLGLEKQINPQDDIWTILSTVTIETDDGELSKLDKFELDLFFILLTVAGSETTRNAISQGLLALLEHPDDMSRLRSNPDAIATAVEEVLRWSSPLCAFARRATEDTEIHGTKIAKGDRLTMWYPSGNRDEDVFIDPFRFDIDRAPNPHMAFGGGGSHFCLGANLARRELTILFEVLFERTERIALAGPPSYTTLGIFNPILSFMDTLPVSVA